MTLDEQAAGEAIGADSVSSERDAGAPRLVITGSLRRAVTDRYEAGESAASIARTLGISKTTVLSILKSGGVPLRHPRLTANECAEITELYQAGVSQVEIARKFDRDPGNIWHVLERAGLVGRKP
ncbi:hypothetical protein [uncultured Jatrophihabitans sp.]|uniref:hypothetical protein n=1 Tax=uncultured Jatrophihabitans sp. TaxID=1610747 RepID=UPI0035CAD000